MPDAALEIQDARYRMQDAGCTIRNTGCMIPDAGSRQSTKTLSKHRGYLAHLLMKSRLSTSKQDLFASANSHPASCIWHKPPPMLPRTRSSNQHHRTFLCNCFACVVNSFNHPRISTSVLNFSRHHSIPALARLCGAEHELSPAIEDAEIFQF